MSKFTDFYAKLTSDEIVKATFAKTARENGIPDGSKFEDLTDEQLNALIPAAKDAGFEFTLDELKAFFKKSSDGSLSDDELEMVAGGKGDVHVECIESVGTLVIDVL